MAAEAGPLVVKADENRKKFTGKRLIKLMLVYAEFDDESLLRLFISTVISYHRGTYY